MDFQRQLFVALTLLLVGFGLLMVYSASVTSWPTQFERVYLSRHLMFLAIGLVAAIIAGTRPPEFWKSVAPWLFVLTILLLLAVLVPGIGSRV
ncbi:MAG TPA: FtsW/RodA/SpoVE family cell cycle protein, partial [Schlesneria sp.]